MENNFFTAYGIWVSISGGFCGDYSAWLKSPAGDVRCFTEREDAVAFCEQNCGLQASLGHNSTMNGPGSFSTGVMFRTANRGESRAEFTFEVRPMEVSWK